MSLLQTGSTDNLVYSYPQYIYNSSACDCSKFSFFISKKENGYLLKYNSKEYVFKKISEITSFLEKAENE